MATINNGLVSAGRENERHNETSGGYKGKAGPRFSDFGGMEEVIDMLRRKVIMLLWPPQVKRHLGLKQPSTDFLLHGPPGCGKTTLVHAIANRGVNGSPFIRISFRFMINKMITIKEFFSFC